MSVIEETPTTALQDRDEMRIGELVLNLRDSFTVRYTNVQTTDYRKGFGVWFALVYAGDDEPNPDEPVAFDCGIVGIAPDTGTTVGGSFCVKIGPNAYIPAENFGDDEDDLAADRFFVTREDAEEHLTWARRRLVSNGLRDDAMEG